MLCWRQRSKSVEVTSDVQRGKKQGGRTREKDGWSPLCAAHASHLTFLTEVKRHLLGQARRAVWSTPEALQLGAFRLIKKWRQVGGVLRVQG